MPITECSDCGGQVSTQAASCPHCGAPVTGRAVSTPLTTVQQTSKPLKRDLALSSVLLVIGLFWTIVSCGASKEPKLPDRISVIVLVIAFVWHSITRFRIWWHHK